MYAQECSRNYLEKLELSGKVKHKSRDGGDMTRFKMSTSRDLAAAGTFLVKILWWCVTIVKVRVKLLRRKPTYAKIGVDTG